MALRAKLALVHEALHGSRTVAVAMATMPSPRPVKPSFSLVVAFTATRVRGMPAMRGDARTHGVAVRRDARRFAHDADVEMRDHAGAGAHAFAGEGEKAVRGDAAPLRVAGRKMLTDVALGERAEHRVDQRMQSDVGIRVAGDPARMRNAYAAEHDVIALDKGVHVEAVPGAHVGERRHAQGFGADEIVAGGQLHVAGLALEHGDALSGPFGKRGIVGEILAARGRGAAVRVEQHREGEGLRRLHHAQIGAVDGRDDRAGAVDLLDGVGDGDGRDGGAGRAAASMARVTKASDKNGRAASWIRTISGSRGAKASSPARTEPCRVAPP